MSKLLDLIRDSDLIMTDSREVVYVNIDDDGLPYLEFWTIDPHNNVDYHRTISITEDTPSWVDAYGYYIIENNVNATFAFYKAIGVDDE